MDRLKELLSEIGDIVEEDKAKQRERDKNGENFNVFKVLRLQRDEERLHSAFIAGLLNPKGAHGMKDTFLKLFKDIFIDYDKDCEKWEFDTKNAIVDTEHTFENGRIDILIESPKEGKGIIIENKIDAGDQKEQLLRYDKFGKSRYSGTKNYQLIYLTPDGNEASEKSTKSNSDSCGGYIMASYKEDIFNWINNCIKRCSLYPIQETLQQYKTNLKDIFGMMNDESTEKLVEKAIAKKYIQSTIALINNQDEIRKQIIKNFISQMTDIAKKYKYEINIVNETGLYRLKKKTWIDFSCPRVSQKWCFSIGAYEHIKGRDGGVRYGITSLVDSKCRPTKDQLALFDPIWSNLDNRRDWPFGWEYLGDGDEKFWWNWKDDWNTLGDMSNGTISRWIETEIFEKDLPRKLLRKIEKYTTNK